MAPTLLVIDDDEANCRLLAAVFAADGLPVTAVHTAAAGQSQARALRPDAILLDLHLPDGFGLDVLEAIRADDADVPIVMLTAHVDVKTAVRATQLGAFDYLTKPCDADELVRVVRRALETRALKSELAALRRQVGGTTALVDQMGGSPDVARIVDQVQAVAASSFSVLVLGETGTGKELVAQAIHRASDRRAAPFVALDCGAIPEALLESELFGYERGAFTGADKRRTGQFQLAEGGTVFLDEIGNLPIGLQAKLLRVLESRQLHAVGAERSTPIDIRIIAATNDDLQARATDGRFRADLYFRLAQYTILLPPLRERTSDIPHLVKRFLDEASVELRRPVQSIAPDALAALQKYTWPGNVRELRNVIRQAVLETADGLLRKATLQRFLARPVGTIARARSTTGRSLREVATEAARDAERQLICETLRETRGNKAQAARALQTDYKTLHLKLKTLGIRARDYEP